MLEIIYVLFINYTLKIMWLISLLIFKLHDHHTNKNLFSGSEVEMYKIHVSYLLE